MKSALFMFKVYENPLVSEHMQKNQNELMMLAAQRHQQKQSPSKLANQA